MLEAQNLSIAYGHKTVLEDISFTFEAGESVFLLGKNGAGKSTLFKALLGFLSPASGRIEINDKNLAAYSQKELAQTIAYIPQKPNAVFPYTVFEMVLMGTTAQLRALQTPGAKEEKRAVAALERLNILRLAERPFPQISGGEQQLAIIARAIAQNSRILLMDEPCASLDYGNQIMVLEMIDQLVQDGYLIFQSSHDPNHAFQYGSKAVVLNQHHLEVSGAPAEVLTSELLQKIYQVPLEVVEVQDEKVVLPIKGGKMHVGYL